MRAAASRRRRAPKPLCRSLPPRRRRHRRAPSVAGPGGVVSAFDFYSTLFSAAKQLGTRTAAVSTEEAERADSTMSVGELCFLLRDFNVMPQLISRAELFFILSKRTLGRELRKRRERHDLLLSMLWREEEDLARDMREAQMVPGSGATARSAGPPPGVGAASASTAAIAVARRERIALRQERIGNMRSMLRRFDAAIMDPSTQVGGACVCAWGCAIVDPHTARTHSSGWRCGGRPRRAATVAAAARGAVGGGRRAPGSDGDRSRGSAGDTARHGRRGPCRCHGRCGGRPATHVRLRQGLLAALSTWSRGDSRGEACA